MTTTRTGTSTLLSTLALVLALVLATAGCSGDPDGDASAREGGHRQAVVVRAPPGSLPTTTTISTVTGKLTDRRRQQLKRSVARTVDGWLDAAYVGGDYPRRGGFRKAFPGFGSGAKDRARRDLALMTNVRVAQRISRVDVRRRELRLDVLAVRGRAAGVTARVLLVFDTRGRVQRRDRVQGRLHLTWRNGGWQVFGYDIARGRS